mgnify:CR=1 FL=1
MAAARAEMDEIYAGLKEIERRRAVKVDLLLICGDFQALRNEDDYEALAVPHKYREMGSFHRYFSGAAVAPVPTIVIGGNHEASNYMRDLFHGGWLAPNIYYLGAAGVVNFGGLRIAGASGIYKSGDYMRGHHERAPFDRSTLRSVYHVRQLQVFQLAQLARQGAPPLPSNPTVATTRGGGEAEAEKVGGGVVVVEQPPQQQPVDVFMSHDWPRGIYRHGNVAALLKKREPDTKPARAQGDDPPGDASARHGF